MSENPLQEIHNYGQSIWLDFIRRHMLRSGELADLIEKDGVRGVTSNPSIFEKAIAGSSDYDDAIRKMAQADKSVNETYDQLTTADVQAAADLFRPLYDRTDGGDGYVSLEVSPHLAHDTKGTIQEARRLWADLNRPNVLIKVPATQEGLPAIQQLISEGINVNVTLLFALPRYKDVTEAYISGLEDRREGGGDVSHVASVASFFLSRIDVLVDPMLENRMKGQSPHAALAREMHGQVAISSAKIAYQMYQEIFGSDRFKALEDRGARRQRLLWASTSTKDPSYSDVKYVETLIGPQTVNTIPMETLNAYRDHGQPAARLEKGVETARRVLDRLPELDIDLGQVTQQLEDEGVEKFIRPFDRLMDTLEQEKAAATAPATDAMTFELGEAESAVDERIVRLGKAGFASRLWRKDPSLWKKDPEQQKGIKGALGWLHVAEKMEENLPSLQDFVDEVKAAGFRHVVHMGMGGSSLAPLFFARTFPPSASGLPLTVLDSTDPEKILEIERSVPLEHTLFIVASKSGTTAETLSFGDYFYQKVRSVLGDDAGGSFVAITDPGSHLADLARERGFRRVFLNYVDIGGRYSALSYFGLVPAALLGVDVTELIARALRMRHACASSVPAAQNPGLRLGAALGELARLGRDKVTFVLPEPMATFAMWLEQLIAESTGKEGKGLLPVAGEVLGAPSVYGDDRLFVHIHMADKVGEAADRLGALRQAGYPVVEIQLQDKLDLAQEFFRWEIATATAGSILGINAFNQPNVQESKDNTEHLLDEVREEGTLPEEPADLSEADMALYSEHPAGDFKETLAAFLHETRPGDYIALMAYLTEGPEMEGKLQDIRLLLRDAKVVATTMGYGPRFLHSTGQLHKGGPNTGVFLQLTADNPEDAAIPDRPYSFGVLKHAQYLGDLRALRKHGRRVIRVHLGGEAESGLDRLNANLRSALDMAPAGNRPSPASESPPKAKVGS